MKKKSGKKWFVIGGVVLVVILLAVFVALPRVQAAQNASKTTTYQTQAVTTGSITGTVGATGNVRTNQTVVINWQTSGIISKIDVTQGQQVKAGDPLAELDPTSLPQSVLNAQNALAADQKALDNLLNSNVARANTEVALITAEKNLVSAQQAVQSKQFQNASQSQIEVSQANLIMAQNALDNATTIYNNNKARSSTDPVYAAALSQFAAAQQKFYQAQANLNYAVSLPNPLDVQLASANLDLAQANYLDAKRNWEEVKDGPNPVDVAAAQAKVAADQAIINQAKPTSPISGTITLINNKPGDLVSNGMQAFQIDDMSHLYVDVSVSEVDIDNVQMGQKVDLTFDAVANKTYPGVVSQITKVGTVSNGVVNYNVTVELQQSDPNVLPGMTASANINIPGPQNVILVPNRAIRTVNGQRVVYIQRNGNLVALPVTLGMTTSSQSEVTGGPVRQGMLIVLNPPSTTTTQQATGIGGIFGRLFGGGAVRVTGGFGGGGFGGNGGNFNRQGGANGAGTGGTGTTRNAGGD
jgi:HlyD family secretion protein